MHIFVLMKTLNLYKSIYENKWFVEYPILFGLINIDFEITHGTELLDEYFFKQTERRYTDRSDCMYMSINFSSTGFNTYDDILVRTETQGLRGAWYQPKRSKERIWLCRAMLLVFFKYPKEIYIKIN